MNKSKADIMYLAAMVFGALILITGSEIGNVPIIAIGAVVTLIGCIGSQPKIISEVGVKLVSQK